jgi:hypothetical protein
MVSLLSIVSVSAAIAYRAILRGQDPQICSGSVRAESRWTTRPVGLTSGNQIVISALDATQTGRFTAATCFEVAIPHGLFRAILERTRRLQPREPMPG